jgi:pilus assembly protein Flp/PilA
MLLVAGKPHTMYPAADCAGGGSCPPDTTRLNGTTDHRGGETMFNSLLSFIVMLQVRLHREEGQTMAEYGILLGVIALVVVGVAVLLGSSISALFNNVAGKV